MNILIRIIYYHYWLSNSVFILYSQFNNDLIIMSYNYINISIQLN